MFRAKIHSEQGPRENLEDRACALVVQDAVGMRAALIAGVLDGVGGNQGGEVASALGASAITSALAAVLAARLALNGKPAADELTAALRRALVQANQAIVAAATRNPDCRGMATTAVCFVLGEDYAHLAWAGDSRAYLFRDGALQQLTRDHTEVRELIELKLLSPDEAAEHPGAHTLTRFLGQAAGFEVETRSVQVRGGDLWLLCTDGLTEVLTDDALAQFLAEYRQTDLAIDHLPAALARLALRLGTTDNVTVLCCQYDGANPSELNRTCVGAYPRRRAQVMQCLSQETKQ